MHKTLRFLAALGMTTQMEKARLMNPNYVISTRGRNPEHCAMHKTLRFLAALGMTTQMEKSRLVNPNYVISTRGRNLRSRRVSRSKVFPALPKTPKDAE
jgi:hypothetical protein